MTSSFLSWTGVHKTYASQVFLLLGTISSVCLLLRRKSLNLSWTLVRRLVKNSILLFKVSARSRHVHTEQNFYQANQKSMLRTLEDSHPWPKGTGCGSTWPQMIWQWKWPVTKCQHGHFSPGWEPLFLKVDLFGGKPSLLGVGCSGCDQLTPSFVPQPAPPQA